MLGEEISSSEVTERGLAGDRAYGLIDVELGKLATAKRPRLWGRLFEFRAAFAGAPGENEPVVIALPDGSSVRSDDPEADRRVSAALGRELRFASEAPVGLIFDEDWLGDIKGEPYGPVVQGEPGETVMETMTALGAPPGTFFDFSPIHLVTTASLRELQGAHPDGRFDPARFRPNILIDTGQAAGFPENDWGDRTISVGDEVKLRGVIPVPRCVMTTLAQGELPRDSGVLRATAERNRVEVGALGVRPCLGLYADVIEGGMIRTGDPVVVD
jgi:MOSC domain-containing protein